MATIVNNPPASSEQGSGNGMGFFLGIIALIIFIAIVFIYVLPYVRNGLGGMQVNVPSDINVNLHNTK